MNSIWRIFWAEVRRGQANAGNLIQTKTGAGLGLLLCRIRMLRLGAAAHAAAGAGRRPDAHIKPQGPADLLKKQAPKSFTDLQSLKYNYLIGV